MDLKEDLKDELEELEKEKQETEEILNALKDEKNYFRNMLFGGYFAFALLLYSPIITRVSKHYFTGIPMDPIAYESLLAIFGIESAVYLWTAKNLKSSFFTEYQTYSEICNFEKEHYKEVEEDLEDIKEEIENLKEVELILEEKESSLKNTRFSKEQAAFIKRYYESIFLPLLKIGLYIDTVFEAMKGYTEQELEIIEIMLAKEIIPDDMLLLNYAIEEPFPLLSEKCPEELTEEEKSIFCYKQCKLFMEKMKDITMPEERSIKILIK